MAKGKKTDDVSIEANEAVDLIALLTPPGCDGRYEGEVTAPEPGMEFDLLAPPPEEPNRETTSLQQLTEALKPSAKAFVSPASKLPSLEKTVSQINNAKPATQFPSTKPVEPGSNAGLPNSSKKSTASDNPDNKAKPASQEKPVSKIPATKAVGSAHLSPLAAIADDSLQKIADEIAQCQKCELCKTRNKTVPGVGAAKARLVLVGEGPGADEDTTGIPFVGRAGQHLDKIIAAAGFKREELFICNILKCRPPENRDPTMPEMLACTPYLQRQLRLINPALIACLGNIAVKFVIGPETPGITRVHGQWFQSIFGVPAMAMYHPSYLIRSNDREKGSPNWQMWQDIQALKKRYDEHR